MGEVKFAEPKFSKDPNAFDICIRVTDSEDPSQTDWARLEMSGDYGKGNFATRTQAQISADTLVKLGFEGDDLSTLEDQIKGKNAIVMIKEGESKTDSSKKFFNVQYFVTGGFEPVEIDKNSIKAKIAALNVFGSRGDSPAPGAPTAASTPPAAAGAVNDYSPFLKCSKCGKPNASKSTKLCKACA
jgi:hypothetical protein